MQRLLYCCSKVLFLINAVLLNIVLYPGFHKIFSSTNIFLIIIRIVF